MWTSVRNFLILVIISCFILFLCIFFILQSPAVCEVIIKKILEHNGYQVQRCEISQISVKAHPQIFIHNLTLNVSKQNINLSAVIDKISIRFSETWNKFTSEFDKVQFRINEHPVIFSSTWVNYVKNQDQIFIETSETQFGKYSFNGISFSIKEEGDKVFLDHINTEFCGGTFLGSSIVNLNQFSYDVEFSFKKLDLDCMAKLPTMLLAKMYSGEVEGSFQMIGDANRLEQFNGAWAFPKGCKMLPDIFNIFVKDLSNARHIHKINEILKNKENILFMHGSTTIKMVDRRQLLLHFNLIPNHTMLDFPIDVDVNLFFNGNLSGLLLGDQSFIVQSPSER